MINEAIKFLKETIADCYFTRDKQLKAVCEVSIEALEKQIPKKPVEDRFPWAICTTCGGSVYLKNVQEHIWNKENTYCEHCG